MTVTTLKITFAACCLCYHGFCPVEDLGSLFEKRDFKDRPRTTGIKSTLSLRLEQCPQQLNNPFNEYSKFDGKVSYSTFNCSIYYKQNLFSIVFFFWQTTNKNI